MSKRLATEHHLQSLDEIRNIMGSMKTLALLETHKLTRFLATQQQVVGHVEGMAGELRGYFPFEPGAAVAPPVYLLLGSERGFCGDFNDRLLHALDERLQADGADDPLLIGVGRKLGFKMENDARLAAMLDGPSVAEEVEAVLGRLVAELARLQGEYGACCLTVVYHTAEADGVETKQVMPPFRRETPSRRSGYPPRLNLAPQRLFTDMVDHYLYAELYLLIYTSLMAENRRRMQHLEGAISRLDEQVASLSLKRNTLRQEEITEEIEVILLSVEAVRLGQRALHVRHATPGKQ